MALLAWLEEHGIDELEMLTEAIEAGEVPDEQVERLRDLVTDQTRAVREEAVATTAARADVDPFQSPFTDFEMALDLAPTPPPGPEPQSSDDVDPEDEEVVVEEFVDDEDRADALERVETLLEPVAGRGFEFYDDLAMALETGDADRSGLLTQDTLDALTSEDRDVLGDRAKELRDANADRSIDDFPEIRTKIRPSGGRDVVYFENVLRELRGEADPDRLPADALEELQRFPDAVDEAIEIVEDNIDSLQGNGNGNGGRGGGGGLNLTGGAGGFSPAPTAGPDVGDEEPFEDTDYITGESITRNPVFEERFVQLAQDLGRASDLDLIPLPPDDYFALSLENQEKYYDVTPFEFMRRAMARGDVTRDQLINHYGFDPNAVPMEGDGGER